MVKPEEYGWVPIKWKNNNMLIINVIIAKAVSSLMNW